MDSDQPLCRHTISSNGRAYASSQLTSASMPERLLSSLKFSSRDSPNSPLSTQFDCDTNIATPSDSIEPQSSTENNLSGASPSSYTSSSIEANSLLCQRSSPSDHDSSLVALSSGGTALSQEVFLHGPESMRHALLKLETVLMDEDEEVSAPVHPYLAESGQPQLRSSMVWKQASTQGPDIRRTQAFSTASSSPAGYRRAGEGDLSQAVHFKESKQGEVHRHGNPSGNLKQLLVDCARALSENQVGEFDRLAEEARSVVSVSGEPIQRLGCYMLEGLVARKECSGTNIYRALRCKEPIGKDLLSFMHILYEVCPYLKFGYMAANGAIAEACRNEERIHIVDFQICQGTQWMTLLQALAARPRGPPHVRITGIDDPMSKYARGDSLELVGKRLAAISAKFNITVEFNPVPVFAPDVKLEMLKIIPGEALAVNFPLQLHHTPDESVDVENPRDGLLRMVRSLHPKVTTLVEQESNTNTTPFLTRFIETMDYYSAMFESIDVTMPRDRKERINVEQHCLAKDIVNIIACEGKERVERHELLGKWKSRFTMAGFRPYPLSSYVNSVIRNLLGCYSENYTLVEKDGAMLLGWKSRMLVSASAWY